MGQVFEVIDDAMRQWIGEQQMFFVSTAPLDQHGLINCSPKGLDSFRILGPLQVAYADTNGSGIETAAHLRENGRIVVMFCAFSGPPRIVRLYGNGTYHRSGTARFDELASQFGVAGLRGVVEINLTRIADSCGYGVPKYDFVEQRGTLSKWSNSKSPEEIAEYQREKNSVSLDGLPGLS